MRPEVYSFQRYLSAKRTVDDRSLNERVWRKMGDLVRSKDTKIPLRMLEIGCGTGAMLFRMLDAGFFGNLDYLGIDSEMENIRYAQDLLMVWSEKNDGKVCLQPGGGILTCGSNRMQICFERDDFFDFLERTPLEPQFDVIAAHAFLDLIHFPSIAPKLAALTKPTSLWYFTINFDGLTIFEPVIEVDFDEQILSLYHRTMDERTIGDKPAGESRTGRRLFAWLQNAGMEILEAGSSDWLIYPTSGKYPADESYFLHFILQTIQQALASNPQLDRQQFENWILERHGQVERGELLYIAHQMDFLAQKPPVP